MQAPLPPELVEVLARAERLAAGMVRSQDREDAIAVARLGVLQAWQRYDPARGCVFATIAYHYARGAVLKWLRDTSGLSRRALESGLRPHAVFVSLDTLIQFPDGSQASYGDAVADPRPGPEGLPGLPGGLEDALLEALKTLTARERELLWLRYWQGRSQREVGLLFGVGQMEISRREGRALRRLRDAMET